MDGWIAGLQGSKGVWKKKTTDRLCICPQQHWFCYHPGHEESVTVEELSRRTLCCCRTAAELSASPFGVYTQPNESVTRRTQGKMLLSPSKSPKKSSRWNKTQAKFCPSSSIVVKPNLTICLSQKLKALHEVRSLLTGDLVTRASRRHLSSAFTHFCKHVNPLSSTGLLWREEKIRCKE